MEEGLVMILRILDCSQYIYAGSYKNAVISRGVRETDGQYSENWAPIGGVRFLVQQAAKMVSDDTVVIPVFEGTPTVKRQMYYEVFGDEFGYKKGRKTHGNDISIQREYARNILDRCGFPVQYVDGYEADDIIYTLVKMYYNDFDSIVIHSADSDLYFLVDSKVTIDKVGDNTGKIVTRENYQNVVNKDEWTCYNVHHIKKLCTGDKSDNIPGIGVDWEDRLDTVIPMSDLSKLGDLGLCRDYLKKAIVAYPSAPYAHRILSTFNILVPLEVPSELINDMEPDVNWDKLRYFTRGWKPEDDQWGFEDELLEYIDSYYK